MKKIVVDMLGSDLGPLELLKGVEMFHKRHPDYELILVGKKEELESASYATIVDAREAVDMKDGALEVIRKKESSMVKAINTAKAEKADGVISAGATGAFLSASTLLLKRIDGVGRPALVTAFPNLNKKGSFVTLLDVGASNVNTPEEIAQFAYMGTLYSHAVYGVENPIVKLLSNGGEEGKGSPEGKEAYKLLKEDKRINFQGNTEGNKLLLGDADVVATDGYTGNVMLKTTEGTAKAMGKLIKKAFKRNIFSMLGYLLTKKGVKEISSTMNPKNVGGAMLLGVNSVAVKAHGNSDAESFSSAMELCYKLIEGDVVNKIREGFKGDNE